MREISIRQTYDVKNTALTKRTFNRMDVEMEHAIWELVDEEAREEMDV
jgi:hypothetical protein